MLNIHCPGSLATVWQQGLLVEYFNAMAGWAPNLQVITQQGPAWLA